MPKAARRITETDIMGWSDYAARRKELRSSLLPVKKMRRISVGPFATFYFENYDTMWLQVQEMLHIEKGGPAQIQGELDTYNPLIPQGGELIATVMLEIEDEATRNKILRTLGGIEESIYLNVGTARIHAAPTEYDERTTPDGKTSSVHWVRFSFSPAEIADFKANAKAVLEVDHPNYGHMAVIGPESRAELAKDFA